MLFEVLQEIPAVKRSNKYFNERLITFTSCPLSVSYYPLEFSYAPSMRSPKSARSQRGHALLLI